MPGKIAKGIVTLAIILYAILLAGWLLARSVLGEGWWAVGYMNAVGIWWFAPLAILLPVALLLRARQATLVGVVMLLPFLWLFGADFIPGPWGAPPEEAIRVRVLTFNALAGNREYSTVIGRITESAADIIAVQELTPDMEEQITAALAESHPYRVTNSWNDPRGIGLWSRYPLAERANHTLERWEWWMHSVEVMIEGRTLMLYNVHLWPIGTTDPEGFQIALAAQRAQVSMLLSMLEGERNPVILAGDFNASPTNEAYERLTEMMDDAWREAGWGVGFTFPARGSISNRVPPFLRIDYVMSRGAVRPLSIEVLPRAGSDHLPVVAEYLLE